ncbi:hypothetical protein CCUS01_07134 [Colletotrichum cuscutae]|uniref:Uncharacterized protein n=1 Tax=Colletotrichum cuscutae TaxID=1209917 RepID=A0AAI9V4N4_9PEZI|nr:hypothetical protein CCUS01_07134 [Colletotrichum cuscutae]
MQVPLDGLDEDTRQGLELNLNNASKDPFHVNRCLKIHSRASLAEPIGHPGVYHREPPGQIPRLNVLAVVAGPQGWWPRFEPSSPRIMDRNRSVEKKPLLPPAQGMAQTFPWPGGLP